MAYNIHPIFVHFPIALLFLYSVIKILPFKKWFPAFAWRDVERILLVTGVMGACVSLLTGETAEHIVRPNHQLVEVHATIAAFSTWVYAALLAGEFAAIINAKKYSYRKGWEWIDSFLQFLERVLCHPIFSVVLAILGFIAISITGMLGGIITYGVSADPLSPLLLKILGITLI